MKLSKNSFTYELIDRFFYVPTNICSLFWKLIFSYVIIIVLALLVTSPIVGVYFLYIEFSTGGEAVDYFTEHFGWLITIQATIGAGAIFASTVGVVVHGCSTLALKIVNKRRGKRVDRQTTRNTNWKIAKEYIKAKKSKMCTIVEWEDD